MPPESPTSPPDSRPLRVAIDVGPLHGHRTGVGTAVAGTVDALGRRADVELRPYLVSFRADPAPGERKLPLPGLVASHVWSRADRPRADRWLDEVDLVHGTNYVAPPSRHPTVVSVYDCWFVRHPELATRVVRRAARTLARAIDRGAWVHACSEATAREVRELFDTDRVATVLLGPPDPPPPADPRVRPAVADAVAGQPFVVAIATEERRKDLPLLVRAFASLANGRPDVQLVLAGAPGDQSDAVNAAIGSLAAPVRDRVHRLGPVDDPTKHWLLRQAAVLAYPSVDEGFGFPILEAQSVGTPVVASDVGSIPEVAGEGAALVVGRDPEAFGAALGEVLDRGRLGLIEAGYRNVGRFSWDATAAGLTDLYRTVAGATR